MTLHAPETLREALGFIVRRQILSRKTAAALVSVAALGGAWQVYAARPAAEPVFFAAFGSADEAFEVSSLSPMAEIEGVPLPAPGASRHGGALFRGASEITPASAREYGDMARGPATGGLFAAGVDATPQERADAVSVPRVAPRPSLLPGGLRPAPMPDQLFAYADPHPSAPRAYAPQVGDLSAGAPLADARDALGPSTKELIAKEGDTLYSLLLAEGVSETEAEVAVSSAYGDSPRRLNDGDRVQITSIPNDRSGATLQKLSIYNSGTQVLSMRWLSSAANFWEEPPVVRAALTPPTPAPAPSSAPSSSPAPAARPQTAAPRHAERMFQARVSGSIYETGVDQGLSPAQIASFVELFRHSVDFERDIRRGDVFEIMFDRRADGSGAMQDGPILYAAMNVRGKRHAFYRFERDDGRAAYFDEKGESNRRAIIRTPVEGRVSSRFGTRRHPISGYTRMHQGVDFAAPTGTPIIAAGDGVVTRRGWVGGYGNYVEIKHNNQFTTAYAHMSNFHKEVKRGSRVNQGQIIGYVGSTGNSTGPHLHFEVIKEGSKIDPMKLQDIGGLRLEKAEMEEFKTRRESIAAKMNAYVADRGQ
ncbi:peptidoglycan DD-metalloendopeptidase family protein [Neomegalonema sp.]|uniref:peptidoglycan DD-metalloendopeptidase family protein n=1 Tax=Neomegalonema sp. TaxID=2039713 RepID=UPI00262E1FD7|nr:peptidoglycan DD-metalloendopeptidase family protein [Neomegalonema sp.]MDD2868195.1 peptidoglycan DD-metalloendopeptidase family protein [Neomegalonema sp.]